jgi:proteasome lid subunit RPN8/RPN11
MASKNSKKKNRIKKEETKKEEEKKPLVAYLSFPAFLTIVSSSVEVFRKETIGYLIGVKAEDKFMVEYAIPYQTADSGFVHAAVDMDRVGRINEILSKVSQGQGLEFVGDFHSHTAFGKSPATVVPSNTDLMSTIPGELNIICAVNMKKRAVRWYESDRGILTGTIGEYRIEIGGYFVEEAAIGRQYDRITIKCPAVTGIVEEKE